MPNRADIPPIPVTGASPIVIGQAAEFEHSGSPTVKAQLEAPQ